MCDPFTLMAAAATGLSAAGSLFSGSRTSKAELLRAEIARGNVAIAEKQAEVQRGEAKLAVQRGGFEESKLRRALEATLGGQVAYFGANAIDATAGSPMRLAAATAAQGETDAGLIRTQAALDEASALGRVAQTLAGASGQATAASQAEERANDAMTAGIFGAATAILKGGATMWKGMPTGGRGGFSGSDYSAWSI